MRSVLHQEEGEGLEPVATEAAHQLVERHRDRVTVCLTPVSGFSGKRTKVFTKAEIEALPNPSLSGATDYITGELEKLQTA